VTIIYDDVAITAAISAAIVMIAMFIAANPQLVVVGIAAIIAIIMIQVSDAAMTNLTQGITDIIDVGTEGMYKITTTSGGAVATVLIAIGVIITTVVVVILLFPSVKDWISRGTRKLTGRI
jgi:UPF0716 family protein affecting phage T7 exclusion